MRSGRFFFMCLPEKNTYKDNNSDRVIPIVTERMMTSFLSARGDSIKESHRDLYFMRYIKFVRSSPVSTLTFVHDQVRNSQKKKNSPELFCSHFFARRRQHSGVAVRMRSGFWPTCNVQTRVDSFTGPCRSQQQWGHKDL